MGEDLDVVSTLGAVTTVGLGAGGGSNGSLAWVVITVGVLAAASFILALDLVGGMYLMVCDSPRVREGWDTTGLSGSVPRELSRHLARCTGGACSVAPAAARCDGLRG